MSNINLVVLSGVLQREPELVTAKSGKLLARGRLSVTRKHVSESQKLVVSNFYVDVLAFGTLAEEFVKNFAANAKILVCGRLQVDSYEADGVRKYKTVVVVDRAERLMDESAPALAANPEDMF